MKVLNAGFDRKPTPKQAVNEKLRVLRDFYIVDDTNKKEYKKLLLDEVAKYPHRDPEIVLDQLASILIMKKLEG